MRPTVIAFLMCAVLPCCISTKTISQEEKAVPVITQRTITRRADNPETFTGSIGQAVSNPAVYAAIFGSTIDPFGTFAGLALLKLVEIFGYTTAVSTQGTTVVQSLTVRGVEEFTVEESTSSITETDVVSNAGTITSSSTYEE